VSLRSSALVLTEPDRSSPIAEARHATRWYGSGPSTVHALRDASVAVHRGEMLAVMGPSGSGKSTLLALLGCLDRPTSGSIRVLGTEVSQASDAARTEVRATVIGFVFQQFHLIDHLDAAANVETALLHRGVDPARRRHLVSEALDRVGLAHRSRHRPQELSGGEQQRVAIARALVRSPSLILADEPTGNLDSSSAAEVLALLRSLVGRDVGLVAVTHSTEVADAADRRLMMLDGRVTGASTR